MIEEASIHPAIERLAYEFALGKAIKSVGVTFVIRLDIGCEHSQESIDFSLQIGGVSRALRPESLNEIVSWDSKVAGIVADYFYNKYQNAFIVWLNDPKIFSNKRVEEVAIAAKELLKKTSQNPQIS